MGHGMGVVYRSSRVFTREGFLFTLGFCGCLLEAVNGFGLLRILRVRDPAAAKPKLLVQWYVRVCSPAGQDVVGWLIFCWAIDECWLLWSTSSSSSAVDLWCVKRRGESWLVSRERAASKVGARPRRAATHHAVAVGIRARRRTRRLGRRDTTSSPDLDLHAQMMFRRARVAVQAQALAGGPPRNEID